MSLLLKVCLLSTVLMIGGCSGKDFGKIVGQFAVAPSSSGKSLGTAIGERVFETKRVYRPVQRR